MVHTSLRRLSPLVATLSLLSIATAQEQPIRFVPTRPIVRLAIENTPALLAALPEMHLGRLFAEPDVAVAIETGRRNYTQKVARWSDCFDRLLQLDPTRATVNDLVQHAVMQLDWRDVHTGAMVATRSVADARPPVQNTLLLEPIAAAEGRLAQRFEQLATQVRTVTADANHSGNLQLGDDKIDGFPALVLTQRNEDPDDYRFRPPGAWLLHLPGQFAGGSGAVAQAGKCLPATTASTPGVVLELAMLEYIEMLSGAAAGGASDAMVVLKAFGLDQTGMLRWQLRPAGALLQEDVELTLNARPGGVLGALLDGMAPLVDQPLPEHGMLQLRCAFDVGALTAAIDELLASAPLPSLAAMGIAEDLKRAWTGGVALAVARPAPGGLIPRLYASFGIVDQQAFGRLIDRLSELPGLEPKPVTYEGRPCVQLRIDGAPPAWQPSYCLQDDVVHFAESGISLRAMLKAAANGAPPALDVGDAPRPDGPGAWVPSFDLRFDGGAIHAALHELWLPLGATFMGIGDSMQPLVPMAEMPEPDTVTPHLRPGRGVLRRSPQQVALCMSSTAGGPDMHVLLAAYGPLLSGPMTGSWSWQTSSLQSDLASLQLKQVHAAITRYRERTGQLPASFGELLASGDLADANLLRLEGDEQTEPVVHEGKEVARTSFRYFPDGKKMSPQGEEVVARVVTLHPIGWRGLALAEDGTLHDTWNEREQIFVVMDPVQTEPALGPVDAPPPQPEPAPSVDPK